MPKNPENKALPTWVVQLLAWVTGVGGLLLDHGFHLLGENSVPLLYYAVCIGIGFGINPGFLAKALLEGYGKRLRDVTDPKNGSEGGDDEGSKE